MLQEYNGNVPLASYLKNHFSQHKKYGSKDRREISALCYQHFRLGHLAAPLPMEERLLAADFIIRGHQSEIIRNLKPEWVNNTDTTIDERIRIAGLQWSPELHSPWLDLLEQDISPLDFVTSHLNQPDLFIRIRPGRGKKVLEALLKAGIHFESPGTDCVRLPNGTELENILQINRDVVIQDLSSQKCGEIIKAHVPNANGVLWDACAASGGKSIMMHDHFVRKLRITASDIRPTILHNLKKRYAEAGVPVDNVFVADLTKPLPNKSFRADVALVDAPCTGSGTWSRTPEQHYYFNPASLTGFSDRQFLICKNVIDHLKPGGVFIYITCSVFEMENRFVTDRLVKETHLELIHAEVIDGTTKKADSMYISILRLN